ncbi:hypothetical protein [Streptomyces bambusae]|uniref:Uncharacterized protein n=1 Tax=Streptomyces bambusae TaxID=1550616 RepID=A0ABS6Z331_9ACTN|nr:hypothetical protein [Streptomyces bambusae]MBW5482156.1 hypothetical protein [Streptomyces bambusae]
MTRTALTRRLALLGVSGALAAGGALLPSSAFAAPAAAPAAAPVAAVQTAPAQQAHPIGNKTTVEVKTKTVEHVLRDGRVKVTTTKTVTKTTKNHHGKVVKKTVTTTVTVRIHPAPETEDE